MEKSEEWGMVQELLEMIDDLNADQQGFVQELFDYLDPYQPFLDQKSEKSLDWLITLHEYYVNGNEEAFEEWDESA